MLALLAILLPQPAGAQESGAEYVVKQGDSLYSIADAFGLSLETLQSANAISDPATLFIGRRLIIPGTDAELGELDFHVLEPGETVASLALRFGQSPAVLARLNRWVNPGRLVIGHSVVMPVVDPQAIFYGHSVGVGPDDTLVGIAAAWGLNPWMLVRHNSQALAGSLAVPGQMLAVPGGETELTALPWPVTRLRVRPLFPEQGRTVSIALQTAGSVTLEGELQGTPLSFVSEGDSMIALQGIHALADVGVYELALRATGADGHPVAWQQTIDVRDGGYGFDPPLAVDPSLIDPQIVGPELEQVVALVRPVTPTRLWDSAFGLPSDGHVTSFFGTRRSLNGSGYEYFHSGTDFYGAVGAPIRAAAPGVVVFAGELKVRGLATIIDHGWGVYTGYWHQSSVAVSLGQTVQAGELIGAIGDTGRVTGPHLHWEVWVGGVQVDPMQWTEESVLV